MEPLDKTEFDMNELVERLKAFMEHEAKSCSMDSGCVTPEYVYRMWNGAVDFKDIEKGLKEIHYGCR